MRRYSTLDDNDYSLSLTINNSVTSKFDRFSNFFIIIHTHHLLQKMDEYKHVTTDAHDLTDVAIDVEEETKLKLVTEPRLTSDNVQTNLSPKKRPRWSFYRRFWCSVSFFLFGMIIYIIYLRSDHPQPNDILLTDTNYTHNIVQIDPFSMTASVHFHSVDRPRTCSDLKYGCCEIFSQCIIKNGYLDYKNDPISFYRTEPVDRIKSNCPTLDQLVHQWNLHYHKTNDPCENTTFGCCPPINTACDYSLRQKRSNDQDTLEFFKENKDRYHLLLTKKKNEEGSNCPGYGLDTKENSLIHAWNDYYPPRNPDIDFIPVFFVMGVAYCCFTLL